MGVLFEPAGSPWCTHWHRDWRDNIPGLELARWDEHFADDRYFNQVNCALYADSCTWVVPGSHLRRDLPCEAARFPERPIAAPDLEGQSAAERELSCREYARSMPGARQLFLDAGDFCLYRNTLWHLGSYVPYARKGDPARRRGHRRVRGLARRDPAPGQGAAVRRDTGWRTPNHG